MELRQAVMEDLPQIKAVFREIVAHMDRTGVAIWDDVYPCEFFGEDIAQRRLYLLTEGDELLSAFALCEAGGGADQMRWVDKDGKALYLDRLGVNVSGLRRGLGAAALRAALAQAKALGAEYLRLFVVDVNEPAISLYRKCGFMQAEGVYHEVVDEDLVLRELGFEQAV